MKISIGADHAGFELKELLREYLDAQGHQLIDHGAHSLDSTDYPDYAVAVGEDVSRGRVDRGILVCSTGAGMSIAANKIEGVRAALAWNPDAARLTREHNDANVFTIGAKYLNLEQAVELVEIFLLTEFLGGRHARRVGKIAQAEQRPKSPNPPPNPQGAEE